jgi:hypothetical protein
MAFVQIIKANGVTHEQYDHVADIAYGGKLTDGELFHVAGGAEDSCYVIEGWETREQRDRSLEKLVPALAEAGISMESLSGPEEFEIHVLETQ